MFFWAHYCVPQWLDRTRSLSHSASMPSDICAKGKTSHVRPICPQKLSWRCGKRKVWVSHKSTPFSMWVMIGQVGVCEMGESEGSNCAKCSVCYLRVWTRLQTKVAHSSRLCGRAAPPDTNNTSRNCLTEQEVTPSLITYHHQGRVHWTQFTKESFHFYTLNLAVSHSIAVQSPCRLHFTSYFTSKKTLTTRLWIDTFFTFN